MKEKERVKKIVRNCTVENTAQNCGKKKVRMVM